MLRIHLDLFNKLPKYILARYANTELFQCPTWYLQSQHEELKKQHANLEEDHRKQGEEFSRTFSDHKQRYLELQQEKEQEISKLKGICWPPIFVCVSVMFCVMWDRQAQCLFSLIRRCKLCQTYWLHFLYDFLWPLSEISSLQREVNNFCHFYQRSNCASLWRAFTYLSSHGYAFLRISQLLWNTLHLHA